MYLLGYTFYNTPLRMAGTVFIAIGSLVAPLNFYALYEFILKDAGASPQAALLLGAVMCTGLYLGTGWWLQSRFLSYAASAAITVGTTAVLRLAEAPPYLYAPTGLALAGLLLTIADHGKDSGLPDFVTEPFSRSSLGAASALTMVLLALASGARLEPERTSGVVGLLLAAVIFGYHGRVDGRFRARAAAYLLIPAAWTLGLRSLGVDTLTAGAAIMTLGVGYLAASFTPVIQRFGERDQWTVRGLGYALASFTTMLALNRRADLALALAADVGILGASAYLFRDRTWWVVWAWSAVVLAVAPWMLVTSLIYTATEQSLLLSWSVTWSLSLALLSGQYLVIGALVNRWTRSLAAPFVAVALLALPIAAATAAPWVRPGSTPRQRSFS